MGDTFTAHFSGWGCQRAPSRVGAGRMTAGRRVGQRKLKQVLSIFLAEANGEVAVAEGG